MKLSGCGHFLNRRVYRTLPCFIGGNSEVIEKYSNWMKWLTNLLLSDQKISINSFYIVHRSTKQLQSPQNRQTSWRSIIWLSWELYRRLVPISSSQRTSRHFQHKDVHENGFERVDTPNEDESNAPTILPSVKRVLSCWNVTRHDLLHIWAVQGEVRNVSWKHRVE